jgi:L-serine dehydratase
MQACVQSGCSHEGVLPGALNIRRRAPHLAYDLQANPQAGLLDPLVVLDWVSLYALAVNEENAAGRALSASCWQRRPLPSSTRKTPPS